MDRQIRWIGLVLLVCFGLLFLQLNNLQVLQAKKLANAPGNPRVVAVALDQPRGIIQTADGVVVAESKPTHDIYGQLRVYPDGPLYADVTGYDSILYGLTGVEATYNTYLRSHSAPVRSFASLFQNRTITDTVTLTISSTLQELAAKEFGSMHGAAVVLDPATGATLAMYSSPTYNPNLLASHDIALERKTWTSLLADPSQPLLPRAYAERYPPGSTFKIITASAVYDYDPSLATKVYPKLTALKLPQTTTLLHNYGGERCGGQLPVLFQVSCDTGFGQIGLDLGPGNLAAEANAFGFNSVPPIDLTGAAPSYFPPPASFLKDLPGLAYSAIGQQNVAASTLQMALAGAAIADHGVIMTPHVMASIRTSLGQPVETYKPHPWRRAVPATTASSVTSLMLGVTQPGGTAPNVAIPGVEVAAKTGTAQHGTANTNDDWLVAFAPAQDPVAVVAVSVNNQPASTTGSSTAGPIARALLEAALASTAGHQPTGSTSTSTTTGSGSNTTSTTTGSGPTGPSTGGAGTTTTPSTGGGGSTTTTTTTGATTGGTTSTTTGTAATPSVATASATPAAAGAGAGAGAATATATASATADTTAAILPGGSPALSNAGTATRSPSGQPVTGGQASWRPPGPTWSGSERAPPQGADTVPASGRTTGFDPPRWGPP